MSAGARPIRDDLDAGPCAKALPPGGRDRERHQAPGSNETRSGGRSQPAQQPPRGVIVFDDGGQIGRDVSMLVQRAAEGETLVEQGANAIAAQVGAELAKIADPGGPAIEEDLALGPACDRGDPAVHASREPPSSGARLLRSLRRWRCRVHARTSARRLPEAACARSSRRISSSSAAEASRTSKQRRGRTPAVLSARAAAVPAMIRLRAESRRGGSCRLAAWR